MSVKKSLLLFSFCCSFMIAGSCAGSKRSAEPLKDSSQTLFWNQLKTLCGKSFKGTVAEAPDGDTSFKGKELILHIRSCKENVIKMPIMLGSNRSRTFVLTRFENKLQWKHDHRHEDGTPDTITMYGGSTTNNGSANMQVFPADQQSVQMRAGMVGNVWWVEIEPGKTLTYNLRRMGSKVVYMFKFDLTETVKAPPPPWGWVD